MSKQLGESLKLFDPSLQVFDRRLVLPYHLAQQIDNIEARLWVLSDKPILPINANSQVDLVNGSRQEEWRGLFDITLYF